MTPRAALLFVFVSASAVQAWLRFGFGRREPVGDEAEYLARAKSSDPFGPHPFLRVPGMAAFVRLAGGRASEASVRNALAAVSVATVMLTAGAAIVSHGSLAALACGLLLIVLPDRMVLSQHVWPDSLLALLHAALLLLMVWWAQGVGVSPWLFGTLAAAAALTRIDALAILAGLSLHPAIRHRSPAAYALLALWLPTVAALAAVSLRNFRRYGLLLPDTTPAFNVSVLAEEQRQLPGRLSPTRTLVAAAWHEWVNGGAANPARVLRHATGSVIVNPWRFIRGAVRRTWQMLGPDTFAIQVLLGHQPLAYPDLPPSVRQAFVRALRVSFPLLASLTIASALPNPAGRPYLLPSLATFLVSCLVHARTRYRYALLPALTFAAVDGIFDHHTAQSLWPAGIAFLAAAILLLNAPPKPEVDQTRRVATAQATEHAHD